MSIDVIALDTTIRKITDHLLAQRVAGGHWEGRLATSALSTATAVAALSLADAVAHELLIRGGLDWLAANVNSDGGWGDTTDSPSNLNTTALCWAALGRAPEESSDWLAAAAANWIRCEVFTSRGPTVRRVVPKPSTALMTSGYFLLTFL